VLKKNILIVTLTATLLAAGVAGFNAVVDPYGMCRLVEIKGFNARKPAIHNRVRLFKAYEVLRVKPGAIVLGTSRSHVAIRMSHKAWDRTAAPLYNLAFDSATPKEMYFYLRHAYSVRPLKQVVLGLDSYQPVRTPCGVTPDFDPGLLLEDWSPASVMRMYLEGIRVLASRDTFAASIATIRSQGSDSPEWFSGDGQRMGAIFFRLDENFKKSPRAYFERTDRLEVGFKLWRKPVLAGLAGQGPAPALHTDNETSLDYIWQIVEFCRLRRVDLRIFITPEHAHQMEIAAAAGAWPLIEQAKRDLVRLLARDAALHPGRLPVPLYDFSGYNSVTTESLPALGSNAEMRYYWDSSHFKEIVGDFVLDRLFNISDSKNPPPADFGVRLEPDTIDAALAGIRSAQSRYRKEHPQDIAWVHRITEQARNENTFIPGARAIRKKFLEYLRSFLDRLQTA
jgi:hypothetical protein